jgi:DNA-binding CsgD family transcriptional regulator
VLTARRPARAIRDMEYRLECYGAGDVGERLSICRRGPRDIIVNAYRDAGAGPFDRAAMEWIEAAAEVVVAAVTRHQELVAAPAPGMPDVTATTAALCALPCGLSLREAEVIAHALAGAGQAETAAAIGVALSSVATYRRRAYAKLGRSDRRGVRALLQDRPE